MNKLRKRLTEQFNDPEYRHIYCSDFLDDSVATQIRVLRESRGLSQAQLGALIGTTQGGISSHEDPDKARWSISTLRKIAKALDVALVVKFESFGNILDDIVSFSRESLAKPSFEDDPAFRQTEPAPIIAVTLAVYPRPTKSMVQRDQTALGLPERAVANAAFAYRVFATEGTAIWNNPPINRQP